MLLGEAKAMAAVLNQREAFEAYCKTLECSRAGVHRLPWVLHEANMLHAIVCFHYELVPSTLAY